SQHPRCLRGHRKKWTTTTWRLFASSITSVAEESEVNFDREAFYRDYDIALTEAFRRSYAYQPPPPKPVLVDELDNVERTFVFTDKIVVIQYDGTVWEFKRA